MHITRTNPTPTETKLTVQASTEELGKAKDIVLKKLAPSVKVAGFRAGKVPPAVIEKNVDPNTLQTEVMEETINKLYASAVRQEELRPVANPEIAIKKFVPFTELEFEATIPTIGQIKIADYTKIKFPKKPLEITAKDVDEVIATLRTRAAERKSVTRAAKDGDETVIDFKGTDTKGEPVNGADGKDYPLALGSKQFIPGFEENVVGMKPGEVKSFTITFPKDYGVAALQSKKVTFEVTLKTVNELVEPKLDDAFAASAGPFKTLKELKEDIKKQVGFEKQREADGAYENELLQQIADKSVVELPKMIVDEQIERIENEERQNLMYRGQTFEEHLAEEGVTAEEHKEQKREAAEQRVKVGVLLSEISEKEGITVTPEEIEIRLQLMRGQYADPASQAELSKPEVARDIQVRIATEKTLSKLTEYAAAK